MPEIRIAVKKKQTTGTGTVVCGNSDYTVVWDLDAEWSAFESKTMRVQLPDGGHQDVVFTGSSVALPVQNAAGWISLGVFAGNIRTSRGADIQVLDAITTRDGPPAAPPEDVYAQIMERLNASGGITPTIGANGNWYLGQEDTGKPSRGATGPQGPKGDSPVKGTDYWTAADKAEMVADVLAALPDGTEVSY